MIEWLERGPDPDDPNSAVRARAVVPATSAYFKGHFPAAPVFPAVAQLALVAELTRTWVNETGRMLAGVSQARFRGTVGPGDELELRVKRAGDELSFRITGPSGPVSQGRLQVAAGDSTVPGGAGLGEGVPVSADVAIERLLPHRAPALLMARLESSSGASARCRGRIPSASPFAVHGLAPAYLGVELGAQAAAIHEGSARAGDGAEPVGMGFIVGVRSVRFHCATLPVDQDLGVEIELVESAPPLRTYRVAVQLRGTTSVEGRVSTWSGD